ncbi:MAG TPA: DUF402 domain-containing protein [Bacillota bacterium]|nr:DUF402 domain-containing protein [Bacillota bacterium]
MTLPKQNENIRILSNKHDGTMHRIWEENVVVLSDQSHIVAVNNGTNVIERTGKEWRTTSLAIAYFYSAYYFNVICMYKSDGIHYYCNISSPFSYENKLLTYVDYDVDIIMNPDGDITLLDEDEFLINKKQYHYPEEILHDVEKNKEILLQWMKDQYGPFSEQSRIKALQIFLTGKEIND